MHRYFIDKLATRVFEVADGSVHVYPGNYEDYLWRKQSGSAPVPASANHVGAGAPACTPERSSGPAPTPGSSVNGSLESRAEDASRTEEKTRRLNPIKRKQLEGRYREIEEEVARVEASIAISEAGLLNFVSAEETKRVNLGLEGQRGELERLMQEWEELGQVLEG